MLSEKNKIISINVIGLRGFPPDFPGISGIEFYFYHLLPYFPSNFSFTLFTKKKYQIQVNSTLDNIKIISVATISSKVLESVFYSLFASIRSSLSESKIVWYHGVGQAIFSFIPKMFGKKIIITIHGLDWQRRKWNYVERIIFGSLSRLSLLWSDQICCVSSLDLKYFQDKLKIPKVTLTLPGIPLPPLTGKQQQVRSSRNIKLPKKYYLFLGRIVPEKRLEFLIDVFNRSKLKEYSLIIAGSGGNYPSYYQKIMKIISHSPSVKYIPHASGNLKEALLSRCSAAVITSDMEGTPIFLMEAIGHHKPVIIAREIAPTDLLKSGYLHLYNLNDPKTLERALKECPAKSVKHQIPDKFSWVVTSQQYTDLIYECLQLNHG